MYIILMKGIEKKKVKEGVNAERNKNELKLK